MIVQLYPQHLNVSPDRHLRFSKTEISFDFLLMGLWMSSSTILLLVGKECINYNSEERCNFIISSTGLGYFAGVLFAFTMIIGIKDTMENKQHSILKSKDHVMFARGNWKY